MKSRSGIGMGTNTITYVNAPPRVTKGPSYIDRLDVSASVKTRDHKTMTPFSFSRSVGTGLTGSCTPTNPKSLLANQTGFFASEFSGSGEPFGSSSTREANLAYERALADVIGQLRGDLDLSIDLFQIKMTRQSLGKLIKLPKVLHEKLNAIKRGKTTLAHEVADTYLEWTYGLKPTAQTVWDGLEKIRQGALSGTTLRHFRGRGSVMQQYTDSFQTTLFGYQAVKPKVTGNRSVRCQIDVYTRADLNRVTKLGEWASLNPVSWGYEMTPYSFVVDWFLNLGGYIRALESAVLYRSVYKTGCKTATVRNDSRCSQAGVVGETRYTLSGSHSYRSYRREVLSSFPISTFPVLHNGLGGRRLQNAAALLSQFIGRKGHPSNPGSGIQLLPSLLLTE